MLCSCFVQSIGEFVPGVSSKCVFFACSTCCSTHIYNIILLVHCQHNLGSILLIFEQKKKRPDSGLFFLEFAAILEFAAKWVFLC